jgi:ribose/xylose/arabinose/galactoside ABC-type transport system permease subunit
MSFPSSEHGPAPLSRPVNGWAVLLALLIMGAYYCLASYIAVDAEDLWSLVATLGAMSASFTAVIALPDVGGRKLSAFSDRHQKTISAVINVFTLGAITAALLFFYLMLA